MSEKEATNPLRAATEERIRGRIKRTSWLRRSLAGAALGTGLLLGTFHDSEERSDLAINLATAGAFVGAAVIGSVDQVRMRRFVANEIRGYAEQVDGTQSTGQSIELGANLPETIREKIRLHGITSFGVGMQGLAGALVLRSAYHAGDSSWWLIGVVTPVAMGEVISHKVGDWANAQLDSIDNAAAPGATPAT